MAYVQIGFKRLNDSVVHGIGGSLGGHNVFHLDDAMNTVRQYSECLEATILHTNNLLLESKHHPLVD